MYKGIVEPDFNHCCSVWDSCGTSKLNKLQKLQNRAARILTNSLFDSSATSLIQDQGWPAIEELIHREYRNGTVMVLESCVILQLSLNLEILNFSNNNVARFGQQLGNHRNLIREKVYLIKCCARQVVYDKNDHEKSQ